MSQIIRETFKEFCARQKAGLYLESEAEHQESLLQDKLTEVNELRYKAKKQLLLENLDLIMRHKKEIINNPRYAGIDAHYAISGGGCYIGPCSTQKKINIGGTLMTISLNLASLLKLWDSNQFKVNCECGGTAVITYFAGSPLSGVSVASGICPCCKKEIHGIKDRNFLGYLRGVTGALINDTQTTIQQFSAKISEAETTCKQKEEAGCYRNPQPMAFFKGDENICDLETMIKELKLAEFQAQNK